MLEQGLSGVSPNRSFIDNALTNDGSQKRVTSPALENGSLPATTPPFTTTLSSTQAQENIKALAGKLEIPCNANELQSLILFKTLPTDVVDEDHTLNALYSEHDFNADHKFGVDVITKSLEKAGEIGTNIDTKMKSLNFSKMSEADGKALGLSSETLACLKGVEKSLESHASKTEDKKAPNEFALQLWKFILAVNSFNPETLESKEDLEKLDAMMQNVEELLVSFESVFTSNDGKQQFTNFANDFAGFLHVKGTRETGCKLDVTQNVEVTAENLERYEKQDSHLSVMRRWMQDVRTVKTANAFKTLLDNRKIGTEHLNTSDFAEGVRQSSDSIADKKAKATIYHAVYGVMVKDAKTNKITCFDIMKETSSVVLSPTPFNQRKDWDDLADTYSLLTDYTNLNDTLFHMYGEYSKFLLSALKDMKKADLETLLPALDALDKEQLQTFLTFLGSLEGQYSFDFEETVEFEKTDLTVLFNALSIESNKSNLEGFVVDFVELIGDDQPGTTFITRFQSLKDRIDYSNESPSTKLGVAPTYPTMDTKPIGFLVGKHEEYKTELEFGGGKAVSAHPSPSDHVLSHDELLRSILSDLGLSPELVPNVLKSINLMDNLSRDSLIAAIKLEDQENVKRLFKRFFEFFEACVNDTQNGFYKVDLTTLLNAMAQEAYSASYYPDHTLGENTPKTKTGRFVEKFIEKYVQKPNSKPKNNREGFLDEFDELKCIPDPKLGHLVDQPDVFTQSLEVERIETSGPLTQKALEAQIDLAEVMYEDDLSAFNLLHLGGGWGPGTVVETPVNNAEQKSNDAFTASKAATKEEVETFVDETLRTSIDSLRFVDDVSLSEEDSKAIKNSFVYLEQTYMGIIKTNLDGVITKNQLGHFQLMKLDYLDQPQGNFDDKNLLLFLMKKDKLQEFLMKHQIQSSVEKERLLLHTLKAAKQNPKEYFDPQLILYLQYSFDLGLVDTTPSLFDLVEGAEDAVKTTVGNTIYASLRSATDKKAFLDDLKDIDFTYDDLSFLQNENDKLLCLLAKYGKLHQSLIGQDLSSYKNVGDDASTFSRRLSALKKSHTETDSSFTITKQLLENLLALEDIDLTKLAISGRKVSFHGLAADVSESTLDVKEIALLKYLYENENPSDNVEDIVFNYIAGDEARYQAFCKKYSSPKKKGLNSLGFKALLISKITKDHFEGTDDVAKKQAHIKCVMDILADSNVSLSLDLGGIPGIEVYMKTKLNKDWGTRYSVIIDYALNQLGSKSVASFLAGLGDEIGQARKGFLTEKKSEIEELYYQNELAQLGYARLGGAEKARLLEDLKAKPVDGSECYLPDGFENGVSGKVADPGWHERFKKVVSGASKGKFKNGFDDGSYNLKFKNGFEYLVDQLIGSNQALYSSESDQFWFDSGLGSGLVTKFSKKPTMDAVEVERLKVMIAIDLIQRDVTDADEIIKKLLLEVSDIYYDNTDTFGDDLGDNLVTAFKKKVARVDVKANFTGCISGTDPNFNQAFNVLKREHLDPASDFKLKIPKYKASE